MPIHHTAGPAAPGIDEAGEPAVTRSRSSRTARLAARLDSLAGRVPLRWRLPLAAYLACQVIFLFWWVAFYPGLMSYDSISYVLHVTTGPWIANHSVLYDSLVWLSLHTTGDLAGLTFAQTVAMSATLAYAVAAFRRLGVPGRWTSIAAVVVAALPMTGAFVVFIWKDVPFTICALLMVPTTAHLVSLRGLPGWRTDRRVNRLIAALGLELFGVMLFRLNGFLIVVLATVALVCVLSGVRGRLTAAATAAIFLAFTLNWYVYPAVGIKRPPASLAFATAYGDIAVAYADRPTSFTTADKRLMARVVPLTQWSASANCYDSDWTTQLPQFTARSAKVSRQLAGLWLRVLGRSPDVVLGARLCRGSIAWRVFPGPTQLQANTLKPVDYVPASMFGMVNWQRVRENPYRQVLSIRPLSGAAHSAGDFLWKASRTPQLEWLLWRGAFWCYLSYAIVFFFARARRNWALLSLAAIVAAQQAGIVADIPAQLFRYMVSPIFIGIMLLPLLFARNRQLPGRDQPPVADRAAAA
jgi:hypothetical protein